MDASGGGWWFRLTQACPSHYSPFRVLLFACPRDRHSEVLRETTAWRHENAMLHEEYAEHLMTSAQLLTENASLKDHIAVSNQEYARVTARRVWCLLVCVDVDCSVRVGYC